MVTRQSKCKWGEGDELMNENIKYFVYNNDANYTSYASIKCLMICVCMLMSLITGTYSIVMRLWHFVVILVIINVAFLLHLLFLKLIYKNTYPMRFLSDWIVDMLLSWLFLNSAFVVLCETKCATNFVVIGTLISYTIFLLLSISWMIKRSKSDVYKKYAQAGNIKRPMDIVVASIIPVSGTIGFVIGRIITRGLNIEKNINAYLAFAIFVVVSMYFSLGHVNLLKYYYCIKYKITCDQQGNATSQFLFPDKKTKTRSKNVEKKKIAFLNQKTKTRSKNVEKKKIAFLNQKTTSLHGKVFKSILWVLIGIALSFVLLFLVFFVKAIISKM